ncbi:MAG TPA: hypothetical protein VKB19_01100 [Pedobacter sp.]|nr:hypothetical protein [Pedobacter sp.]
MEAFNIKITYGTNLVTLTVLPVQENIFKLIYFGGIIGTICFDGKDWDLVTSAEMLRGDHLPPYRPGKIGERTEIELTDHVIDKIGWEIELERYEEVA